MVSPREDIVQGRAVISHYGGQGPAQIQVREGDAMATLEGLEEAPRLVYIDPPFAAEQDFFFGSRVTLGGEPRAYKEVAYSDRWEGGLQGYLTFMRSVVEGIHEVLADDGSLLLHCDHRAAPYLAVLCDEVFGMGDRLEKHSAGFRNSLVWTYGLGGSSPRSYPKKHDTILWYTKSRRWHFVPPMVPATSQRLKGKLKKAPDVLAIPTINNMATERTGYPTQKPLALMELLLKAHTEPGDLVLDLFAGSGSTAHAAVHTGRRCITSDIGARSLSVLRARLPSLGASVSFTQRLAGAPAVSVVDRGDGVELKTATPLIAVAAGHLSGARFLVTHHWETPSLREISGQDGLTHPYAPGYLVTDLDARTYLVTPQCPSRPPVNGGQQLLLGLT